MNFVSSRPDVVRSVNQRWLLQHWLAWRRDDRMPSWQQLDAQALTRMADTLAFSDVVEANGQPRFLVRFNGARLRQAFGNDCRDRFIDEVLTEPLRDTLLTTYRKVVTSGWPVYTIFNLRDRSGRVVHYERLLLPFTSDGSRTDRILGSYEFFSPDGAFDNHELLKSPETAPPCVLRAAIHPSEVPTTDARKLG
jgi:hypothetical protein